MKTLQVNAKQKGFTIIELVVVILLLGILAATALPRFFDATDEAHAAAYDGVVGGFTTGIAMFEAQWVASGEPTEAIFEVGNLRAGSNGFPASLTDSSLNSHTECRDVFRGVLQGGPSVIEASNTFFTTGTDPLNGVSRPAGADVPGDADVKVEADAIDDGLVAYAAAGGYNYLATLSAAGECTYIYLNDAGDLSTPRSFVYTESNGGVAP